MAKILKKKYRTFDPATGEQPDPLFDYDKSTTYHYTDNAEEWDKASDVVAEIIDNDKFKLKDLPKVGERVEADELYKYNGQVYRVRKVHNVTVYSPDQIQALFTVYRKETADMEWIEGEKVDIGALRTYKDIVYECIQSHQTQEDWTPDKAATLWKVYVSGVSEWVQPTGAHDAYNKGDRVLFDGKTYESLIDVNVWSPAVYPVGWKKL